MITVKRTNTFVGLMSSKGIYGFPTRILLVSEGKILQLFGAAVILQAMNYLQQD